MKPVPSEYIQWVRWRLDVHTCGPCLEGAAVCALSGTAAVYLASSTCVTHASALSSKSSSSKTPIQAASDAGPTWMARIVR